jgi:hypothetical protein
MDEVVGTAILQTQTTPQRLYLLYKAEGKEPSVCVIDVHQNGTPKISNVSWEYRIDGNLLHMQPSLHIRHHHPEDARDVWRTDFHNGFNWTVKYQTADVGSEYRQLRLTNGMPVYDET